MHIKEWIQEHPWGTAGIVGGVGLLFLWWWFSGSSSSSGSDTGLSSYYAAEAAAAQSGNQLAALNDQYNAQVAVAQGQQGVQQAAIAASTQQAQINANAATAADQAAVQEAQIQAQMQQAIAQSTNQAAVQLAKLSTILGGYQTYSGVIMNAQNQGYGEGAIADLIGRLPPPPGANPANYSSTGGMYTPAQAANILKTLPPNIAKLYITGQ